MANRYKSLAVFLYPFDPDSGGTIRWKGDVIASGVTDVTWAGGGLLATTRDGVKRVRCEGDGVVTVEDAAPAAGVGLSRDELSATARHVADFFCDLEAEPPPGVNRDVAAFLSLRKWIKRAQSE